MGCLLDGCAGCNSVTEELVVGAIKAALKDNIPADSSKFPVAQLECWPKEDVVMGLANGAPINLKGAAVIRVTFPDVTGKKDREILVRAKITAKGCSTWQGLILGGRALDAVERGGLGFRPGANAQLLMPWVFGCHVRKKRKNTWITRTRTSLSRSLCLSARGDKESEVDEKEESEQVEGEVLMCSGKGRWVGEEGDWVPVRRSVSYDAVSADPRGSGEAQEPLLSPVGAVLPLVDAPVEVVPGLWDQRSAEGYVYVVPKESEAYLEEGSPIAAVVDAVAEQAFCKACGHFDAAAWVQERIRRV